MNLEFESDRLKLRPLSENDLDLSFALWLDPDVTKYVGEVRTKNKLIEEHPIAMRRCCGGCIGIWALTTKQDNEKIGTAILLPMPVEEDDTNWDLVFGDEIPDCDIEIGYMLKKTAWGKGYATEACARLLRFAFEESPLTEIVATTDVENAASQYVLLKCGLRQEGMIRAYATHCPGFRITKKQWQKDKSVAL